MKQYVIGLDYGTDSVRAILIDTDNGKVLASSTYYYSRWGLGKFCAPQENRFRQHPQDHIDGLQHTIKAVLSSSKVPGDMVKGIAIVTTGSSPLPVTKHGEALALQPGFEYNPNAMVILWKDHTAIKEAKKINELTQKKENLEYTKFEGGIYSSEWFWAKIAHIYTVDEKVKEGTFTWMEHCDYLTFLLIEERNLERFKRSRCAAGHKAMWHESWDGLPPKEFLNQIQPDLGILRDRLYTETYTSDQVAGYLSKKWAKTLGLTTDCVVAVGSFDAHAGAVGAKIDEHTLVRVMGTSTCDIMVAQKESMRNKTVRGICGQVDGSVVPGMIGLEAGQSAFGDVLAWFKSVLKWPLENHVFKSGILSYEQREKLRAKWEDNILDELSRAASEVPVNASVPIALDWINGRRSPDANQELKSAIINLSLGTKTPHIFRALIESICFGAKQIVDRFVEEGVAIDSVIGIGGVARKSPFIMQCLANVLNMPIRIAASDEAPALGAAVYASVAAGIFPDVITASKQLGSDFEMEYFPEPEKVVLYTEGLYRYKRLGSFIENNLKKTT